VYQDTRQNHSHEGYMIDNCHY